ncbi:MAG: type II toxin-antitoxin system RelE/ParE family toxin [Gemmatimonadota bacterium]|nr:type II toxin-antitoxin system RelE/ParE family toxin [Gemmatimonadota bacterium]
MFTPLASADIEAAFKWYEDQRPGLGARFTESLETLWDRLDRFPQAGPEVHHGIRRMLVPRFPYAVYYRLVADQLEVRAVLHQHSDPSTWHQRT